MLKARYFVPKTIIVLAIIVFSGCSSPETQDITKRSGENVSNKESEKSNNSLSEKNMNSNQEPLEVSDEQNKPFDLATLDLKDKYNFAILKTNYGDIKLKFYSADAPMAVNNFLKLASDKFYDGAKFHRVIKGFMIQGGDPFSKDDSMKDKWGTGGPGYKFKDELKGTEKYPQGTLAMANSGPNTNGSQFFIVTASPGYPLPSKYTVFGQVIEGMNVALKIENVKTEANDRPEENVIINNVELLKK